MANKFLSDIDLTARLRADGNEGDPGQVLSSTGTGVEWIDQASIEATSDFVFFNVKNETGSTILKGKGIMAVGTDGNSGHILIDEMVANGTVEAKYFLGVLEEDIPNGGFARVISFGQLDQFNTNGQNGETWANGQILWCDPANPGDFTTVEPDGPNVKIAAAFILNKATNGKIQVRVQANEGVHDLHDTKITSQIDGDVLVWNEADGVWFNDSTLNVDYAAGSVGIGITSPQANRKLDVNGHIQTRGNLYVGQVGSTATSHSVEVGAGRGNDGIAYLDLTGDTTYLDFGLRVIRDGTGANTTSRIIHRGTGSFFIETYEGADVVFNTGNVGIGTPSPFSKLHVSLGNTAGDLISYGGTSRVSNGLNKIAKFYHGYWSGSQEVASIGVQTTSSTSGSGYGFGELVFHTGSSGNGDSGSTSTERMRIDASGNVGIGTDNPSNISNFKILELNGSNGNGGYLGFKSDESNQAEIYSSSASLTFAATGNRRQSFYTNGVERMRIDSSGRIGINDDPTERLVINGGSSYARIKIRASSLTSRFMTIGMDDSTSHVIDANGAGSNLILKTVGSEKVRIDSDGNVGVGTDNPGAKLDVSGTTRIRSSNSSIFTTSKFFSIDAASNTNIFFNISNEFNIGTTGLLLVEITVSAYGSAGAGGGVYKYIAGGYSGHNISIPYYHPHEVIANTTNGNVSLITPYNPSASEYGVTILNSSPNRGISALMEIKVTTTY